VRGSIWTLGAVLVASVAIASPGKPALGQDGTLAFSVLGSEGFDLSVANPGGTTPITAGSTNDTDPAWSPAGDRLALARHQPGNPTSDIWTMHPDGGAALRLTTDYGEFMDRHPAWSPDGRWIAWTRSIPRTGTSAIWVMDAADGRPARPLTDPRPGIVDAAPAWSPDGGRIAFQSNRGRVLPDLFVMPVDGSGRRRITDTGAIEGSAAWSPDGERIAFERTWPGHPADIWTVDPATGEETNLTGTPDWETDPSWSPDGSRIAYVGAPRGGGDKDLMAMDPDGSGVVPLAAGPGAELTPAWQPAGGAPAPAMRAPDRVAASAAHPVTARDRFTPARYATAARWLMDGVRFQRIVDRRAPNRIFVVRMNREGPSTVDVGLGSGILPGYERTTSIARRHRAVAAINGDFPVVGNGRPSHAYAEDGELGQTSFARTEVFSMAADESAAVFRRPLEMVVVREDDSGQAWRVNRWNARAPASAEVGGYSSLGGGGATPPGGACSARLVPTGDKWWTEGRASVAQEHHVDAVVCRASRLSRGPGVVIAARPGTTEALLVASLTVGETVSVEWTFGWQGTADAMGGIPLLVKDGRVAVTRCRASLCRRHPRTGVGVTEEGEVLLVVVDGRRRLSRGLTLVGLARLFRRLGATWALNLDGGGSSTMVVRGRIVNVPSDGRERPVCCSIMVLPGPDPGEVIGEAGAAVEATAPVADADAASRLAALDPASSGGLADALARGALDGYRGFPGLRSALRVFRSPGRSQPGGSTP
jgi:Tol biopolymer transport system component/exopolysaccharide biosynthesis protein